MKRKSRTLWIITAIVFVFSAALYAQDKVRDGDKGWTINVEGVRADAVEQLRLDEASVHPSHFIELELEKKGVKSLYGGIPLRMVVAMADGTDAKHPYIFDEEAWNSGYDISLVAADGYTATFNTKDVPADALIIAVEVNGESIAPMIAGEVQSSLWVQNLAGVELDLKKQADADDDFRLMLSANNETHSFTLPELESSPLYIEGTGSYTTSAGTTYTHSFGGVRFADFLKNVIKLDDSTPIQVVAMDGYEMTYSGEQITDESDGGVWILAFKMDGEYLPLDPGYIRTVKIGEGNPNIPGHSSMRMIREIRVSGDAYREFTLQMTGKLDFEIDRQTLQTGISCHERTITYFDRKSESEIEYTGIPLWRLLAYSDDARYAPHKQDSSILSYDGDAAQQERYTVKIEASDGFTIELDSAQVHMNDDVIIAMFQGEDELPDRDWPLVIVWDKDAAMVPDGIKAVRNIAAIHLIFDE